MTCQQERRGLKHPEAVKAKQKRREEAERQARAAGASGDTALKVREGNYVVALENSRYCTY